MISECPKGMTCPYWKILEVTRQLTASIELPPLLEQVVNVACSVLDADRASVFLYDNVTDELYSKVAKGENEIRFTIDKASIAGHTMRMRQIVNVPDCYNDPRHNPEIDQKTGYRTRSLLSLPLIGEHDEPVGVLQVLNKRRGPFDKHDEEIADVLAAQCAVALQRAILLEDQITMHKLERDLAVAREIQMAALPKHLPQVAGFDLAGWTQPAEQTGGDIYDVVSNKPDRLALMLGDATGHGIGPALSVTQVRAMFRIALRLNAALDAVVDQVNAQLTDDLPASRFVTAFIGLLDTNRHELVYHSAGQAPLLHYVAQTGECLWLEATTMPLGITNQLALEDRGVVKLSEGDIFALISDGVYEYHDGSGQQFGKQRVEQVVRQSADCTSAELIAAIRDQVNQFAGLMPQLDDMTILLIKREKVAKP